jgi:hypothetical protein
MSNLDTTALQEQLRLVNEEIRRCASYKETIALEQRRSTILKMLTRIEELKSPQYVLHMDQAILDDRMSNTCPELKPVTAAEQKKIEEQLDKLFGSKHPMGTIKARPKRVGLVGKERKRPRYRLVRLSMMQLGEVFGSLSLGLKLGLSIDIPEGARMVRWFPDPLSDCLCLVFEHESFPELEEGAEIPNAAPGVFVLHD